MMTFKLIPVCVGVVLLGGFTPPEKRNGFHDAAKSFHASGHRGLAYAGLYESDDGSVRFVLERGEDGWRYVCMSADHVVPVKEKVNYRGDRFFLAREDGRVIVKIAAVGGVTAFTEERKFGVPVVRVGAPGKPAPTD